MPVSWTILSFATLAIAQLAESQTFLDSISDAFPNSESEPCWRACRPGEFLDLQACSCIPFLRKLSASTTTTTLAPPPTTSPCLPRRCPWSFLPCSKYHVDDKGCETCRCKCTPFSLVCPTDCRYGTEFTRDQNDCKKCACAAAPTRGKSVSNKAEGEIEAPRRRCPPVCSIYCPYGHILDTEGCPTCACMTSDMMPW